MTRLAFPFYDLFMELQKIAMDVFLRSLIWANQNRRKMMIREIGYETAADGRRRPIVGQWFELHYHGGRTLYWTNPSVPFFEERERSVKLDRTMRYRMDTLTGKADIRGGKGLYLQIRIEIPDLL